VLDWILTQNNPVKFVDPDGNSTWSELSDIVVEELKATPSRMVQSCIDAFWWPSENPDKVILILVGGQVSPSIGRNSLGQPPSMPVADRKLANYVKDFYKGFYNPNRIGSGTTADAVKFERATGQPVGGRWHTQKAQDLSKGLENWLRRNTNASASDRAVAQDMLDQLNSTLNDL
jgi:hypothetical protein